ncbi:MAG: hypothetical protein AB1473_17400 [Thermodesulfobacteriota bacterium]
MSRTVKVVGLVALVIVFAAGSVTAAGYERIQVNDNGSKGPVKPAPSLAAALKEASFIDKVPKAIEDTLACVKDLLGQFGVLDK